MGIAQTYHRAGDRVWTALFGKPDAVIIGEVHIGQKYADYETETVLRYKPEYVLMEGFDTDEPEDNAENIRKYKTATLREVADAAKFDLKALGTLQNLKERLNEYKEAPIKHLTEVCIKLGMTAECAIEEARKCIERKVVIPEDYDKFVDTPFYEFDGRVNAFLMENVSEFAHSKTADENARLFSESMHDAIYETDKIFQRKGSDKLFHAMAKVGAQLAGCDDKDGKPEMHGERTKESKAKFRKKLNAYLAERNEYRERYMGRRIADFAGKRKTDAPVVAIIGMDHTNKGNFIFPVLEERNINYRILAPRLSLGDVTKIDTMKYEHSIEG